MKKICLFFFLCFLLIPFCLFADDSIEWAPDDTDTEDSEYSLGFNERAIEVGIANLNFGLASNFITLSDIFQEKIVIDLNDLEDGLKLNFGFALSPIYFSYNSKGRWGFSIFTGVDMFGNIGFSGDMLTFSEADDTASDVNAAAFAEIGGSGFFHVDKFKIKVGSALYYPLIYVKPDTFSYTYSTDPSGTVFWLDYDVLIYSAFPMDGDFEITALPGFDLYFGVEYPLSEVLGLKEISTLLDFKVGLDFYNVPLIPATMSDYMQVKGKVGGPDPVDFFDDAMDMENFLSMDEIMYGKGELTVYRPFKMLLWAEWRPFDFGLLTFIPILGFSINELYNEPASFEGGVKARLDLSNIFLATLGIGYYDRLWMNSLDLSLNLRAFQLDLGVNMQAPELAKSWSGGGIGLNFGLKFGW